MSFQAAQARRSHSRGWSSIQATRSSGGTAPRLSTVDETVQVPLSARNRFGALLGRSARMREVFAVL